MAANIIIPGQAQPLVAQTQNPSATQIADSTAAQASVGRHGQLHTADVHGRAFAAASRGNLYWGTSGTSGIAPLAPGGTTAGFVLYNPASSGVIVEVQQLRLAGGSTETVVISGLALEGSIQVPSGTLTGCTVSSMPLGAGNLGATTAAASAKAKVYGAATITAMTFIGGLGNTITATTSPSAIMLVDFNGTLLLSPGMAINLVSTITNTGKIIIGDWLWSEWLP